jgi:hypothetical protein
MFNDSQIEQLLNLIKVICITPFKMSDFYILYSLYFLNITKFLLLFSIFFVL